jgi:hypothetical protein
MMENAEMNGSPTNLPRWDGTSGFWSGESVERERKRVGGDGWKEELRRREERKGREIGEASAGQKTENRFNRL